MEDVVIFIWIVVLFFCVVVFIVVVILKFGIVGNFIGVKCRFVLFKCIELVVIIMLLIFIWGWIVLVVLMCKKVCMFNCVNFLIVIDVEGLLILVEYIIIDCLFSFVWYMVYLWWFVRKIGLFISFVIFCIWVGLFGIIVSVVLFKFVLVILRWNMVLVIGGFFNCVYLVYLLFRVWSYFIW